MTWFRFIRYYQRRCAPFRVELSYISVGKAAFPAPGQGIAGGRHYHHAQRPSGAPEGESGPVDAVCPQPHVVGSRRKDGHAGHRMRPCERAGQYLMATYRVARPNVRPDAAADAAGRLPQAYVSRRHLRHTWPPAGVRLEMMARRPEHAPGEPASAAGTYEQLNIFGSPTGICVKVRHGASILRNTMSTYLEVGRR